MKKQKNISLLLVLFTVLGLQAQPTLWRATGIGGGGALFSPSINPGDENEYYVACDMSDLFHSRDFGLSYDVVSFTEVQSTKVTRVAFTSDPLIRYTLHSNEQEIITPVKTIDGGITWSALTGNPEPYESAYSIFTDRNVTTRVLLSFWSRVYFSTDGGITFNLIHTAENSGAGIIIGGMFCDADNIYIGTNDGVLVSTDGGASFTRPVISGIPTNERIFSFAGAKEGTTTRFFCLTGDESDTYLGLVGTDYWGFIRGVYSLDYGPSASWTPKMNGIDVNTDYLMYVAMAENSIDTAYLAGSSSSSVPNVMKTTDAGASWTHIFQTTDNQNIYSGWSGDGGDRGWGYGECIYGISVAAENVNKAIFSDMGFVHKTADGGMTWHQAYVSAADENPSGSRTPTRGNYHSVGLENTSCWQVLWVDSQNLFAAYSDIKGIRSTDAGDSWSFDYSGHDQNTMYRIAKHSNGTLYAATSTVHDIYQSTHLTDSRLDNSYAKGKVLFSTDNGATWQTLHDFNRPVYWVALDPSSPNRLYASVINYTQGLGGVYRSDDIQNGALSTWSKLADPPRTEGHPAAIHVLDDGNVLCTYSGRRNSSGAFTASSGVFLYNSSTNSWSDLSDPGMTYWCQDVVVDPFDAAQNTWYVCVFSGWGGPPNGLGGLYRTTDRGANWNRISDLDRVQSCTVNPDDQNQLYLTTEMTGLWFTDNLDAANPVFNQVTDYPFRHPTRVFFNPFKNSEIWVSSFGNGMRVGTIQTDPHVEVKLFCQGFYETASMMHTQLENVLPLDSPYNQAPRQATSIPTGVVDWLMLEFRSTPSGESSYHRSFFLRQDGQVAELDGLTTTLSLPGLQSGSYYVVVRHRNHVQVMSRNALDLNETSPAVLDFSADMTQYYGSNSAVLLSTGVWGIPAADIDQDGQVTSQDYVHWYNGQRAGDSGYLAADVNGDQMLDQADLLLWNAVAVQGISSHVP